MIFKHFIGCKMYVSPKLTDNRTRITLEKYFCNVILFFHTINQILSMFGLLNQPLIRHNFDLSNLILIRGIYCINHILLSINTNPYNNKLNANLIGFGKMNMWRRKKKV